MNENALQARYKAMVAIRFGYCTEWRTVAGFGRYANAITIRLWTHIPFRCVYSIKQ